MEVSLLVGDELEEERQDDDVVVDLVQLRGEEKTRDLELNCQLCVEDLHLEVLQAQLPAQLKVVSVHELYGEQDCLAVLLDAHTNLVNDIDHTLPTEEVEAEDLRASPASLYLVVPRECKRV